MNIIITPYSQNKYTAQKPQYFRGHLGVEYTVDRSIPLEKLICETSFFRGKKTLNLVKQHILNNCKNNKTIRIVSCGCSSGEEGISMSMLLESIKDKLSIIGIDLSKSNIAAAKSGIYTFSKSKQYHHNDEFLAFKTEFPLSKEEKEYKELFDNYFEIYKPKNLKEKVVYFFEKIKRLLNNFETSTKKYKLKEGKAQNCSFIEGNVLDIENLVNGKVDAILYRNSLYHMICYNDINEERAVLPQANNIIKNIIVKFKNKLKDNGLLVLGEKEDQETLIPYPKISEIIEKNGFKKYEQDNSVIENIWIKEG
jgi:chemotaxis methyl-accepting protein methylase